MDHADRAAERRTVVRCRRCCHKEAPRHDVSSAHGALSPGQKVLDVCLCEPLEADVVVNAVVTFHGRHPNSTAGPPEYDGHVPGWRR